MICALTKVTSEAEEIKGFRMKLTEPFFSFKPGQYVMISFPETPEEKRAFSIADYDKEKKDILLVIKKNGSFTQKLFSAKIGQKFNVYGPYGRFTLTDEQKPLVFIAGGIGITPLYCVLNHVHASDYGKKLYLYYIGKSKEKMALLKELEQNEDERINIEFIFTAEGGKRITSEDIRKNVPEFNESLFYICGPSLMIENITNELIKMNISEERIKSEEFT